MSLCVPKFATGARKFGPSTFRLTPVAWRPKVVWEVVSTPDTDISGLANQLVEAWI
jgi:hypothetical protein